MLGKQVRDKVTGFEGTATGRAEYIYGCTQFCIVPKVDKEGKACKAEWFDEGRLEITGDGISASEVAGEKPGGPNRDAPSL